MGAHTHTHPRPPTSASTSAALSPSELQSEMGHPWSRVEKGQAPLLMWR